jgi:WG containing repeat
MRCFWLWLLLCCMAGKAAAQKTFRTETDEKTGLTGLRKGDVWLLPPVYDEVSEGFVPYLLLFQNGRSGAADTTGRIIVPCQYDAVHVLDEDADCLRYGLIKVRTKGLYGVYRADGRMITPLRYTYEGGFYWTAGVFVGAVGKYMGLIDTTGKELTPFRYDIQELYFDDHGLALVRHRKRYGMLHVSGQEWIPTVYDEVMPFDKRRAYVCLKKKWGLYDMVKGTLLVPCTYADTDDIPVPDSPK